MGLSQQRAFLVLPAILLLLGVSGCDWYGRNEVAIRPLPYPYAAGITVDTGDAPACLASRGVEFRYDGEDVRTAGQDAACSLVDRARQLWDATTFFVSRREWRGGSFFANRLFEPRSSESSATTYTYKRYVGSVANLSSHLPPDLAAQVAEGLAYEIKAKGGVAVIQVPPEGPQEPLKSALDHMRGEHAAGEIYLTDLDRLLEYCFICRYLDWDATITGEGVTIRVHAVDPALDSEDDGPPASASRWIPTQDELAGVTFYSPDPVRTRVLLAGVELTGLQVNPPDRTRRGSVTIPPDAMLSDPDSVSLE